MPVLLIAQALLMARLLDDDKVRKLVSIVRELGGAASFRNIVREAARRFI